jgi:putative flippase GtrA
MQWDSLEQGTRERKDAQVTYARKLYERFRHLIHEVAKFGVVGVVAFLLTEVGTNLLYLQSGLGPLTSNVIATVVATCVSFGGNRYWTFRHRDRTGFGREYVLFFALNGVGLVIQLACLGLAYYVLGLTDKLSYNVALIIGIGFGTLFRFWSYRAWVWRAVPPADAAGTAGLAAGAGPPPAAGLAAPGPAGAAGPAGNGLPKANGHLVGGPGPALPPVRGGTGMAEQDAPR